MKNGSDKCIDDCDAFVRPFLKERPIRLWLATRHNATATASADSMQFERLCGGGGATRSVQRWYDKDKTVILIKLQLKLSISSHKAEPLQMWLAAALAVQVSTEIERKNVRRKDTSQGSRCGDWRLAKGREEKWKTKPRVT